MSFPGGEASRTGLDGPDLALNERAFLAATDVALDMGIEQPLDTLRIRGSSSWVYVDEASANGRPGREAPTVAIHLATAEDPQELFVDTARDVALVRGLREPGVIATTGLSRVACLAKPRFAPVQNFIDEPRLHGGFVTTVSEYLPYPLGSLYAYGRALATLRNISEERPEVSQQASAFAPLEEVRRAYEYLAKHPDQPWIAPGFIEDILLPQLEKGEKAVEQMLNLHDEEERPYVVMPHDVTLANALRDRNGTTTLIDLGGMMYGPAEFALGRPLGQWAQSFNRPAAWANDLRRGYEDTARLPLDPTILRLAVLVSRLKYAVAPLVQAIEAVVQGETPSPWAVYEGARRLATVDDPKPTWISQEAYLRDKNLIPATI
jgi:hypothetical protein